MVEPYKPVESIAPADRLAAQIGLHIRPGLPDGFASTLRALYAGKSAAVQMLGDSTGASAGDFLIAAHTRPDFLATLPAGVGVSYRLFEAASQDFLARVIIQAGTAVRNGASGDEHILFDFTQANERSRRMPLSEMAAATSTSIDLRVDAALVSWANGAEQHLVSAYSATTTQGPSLKLKSDGKLRFNSSAGGVANASVDSTVSVPFAALQRGLIRTTAVPGGVVTFYTGDPTTEVYTQLGATVAAPAAFNVDDATGVDWALAARNPGQTTGSCSGSFFGAEIRDGINGPVRNPQPIDSWHQSGVTDVNLVRGSPQLRIENGSQSGAKVEDYNAARVAKAIRRYDRAHVLTNFGHNSAFEAAAPFIAKYDTMLGLVRARTGNPVPITLYRQHPAKSTPPTNTWTGYAEEGILRQLAVMEYAARNGLGLVDNYEAFRQYAVANGSYLPQLDYAGPHPTSAARSAADLTINGGVAYPQPYGVDILAPVTVQRYQRWVPSA